MKKMDLYLDKYFLKGYKEYLVSLDKTELTIDTYIGNIITFIEWFNKSNIDEFDATTCTTIDLRDFRSFLINVKCAKPNTVNLKIMSLKSFFNFLSSFNYIKEDISKNIKKIKLQDPLSPKGIDEKTYRKLRREIFRASYPHHIAIFCLLSQSMRLSEVINLKIDNIYLSERGAKVLINAKHGRSRELPLNTTTKNAILEHLKIREKIRSPYNNLFLSERKAPYSRSGIWKIFANYSNRIGCHISPHQLRHYSIKKMVDSGISLITIANLVGHSSLQLLSDVYAIPSSEQKLSAVELLDY